MRLGLGEINIVLLKGNFSDLVLRSHSCGTCERCVEKKKGGKKRLIKIDGGGQRIRTFLRSYVSPKCQKMLDPTFPYCNQQPCFV